MNTILCIFLDTRYIHTHIISFAHLRAFFQIFFQECQRQKIKKKKLLIFTNLRLMTQVKEKMKQSFLDGRIRTISSFLARLWAIIESDLFFEERNTSKLLSGEKIVEGLVLGEINTQICGLSSPTWHVSKLRHCKENFKSI